MSKSYDVIVATYNGEKFVIEQIESIRNQTIKPRMIYIRDDMSTDNTLDILKLKYGSNDKIEFVLSDKNVGYIKNFELLSNYACADYVFFSDQDDVWLPNKAELFLSRFNEDNQALVVFSDAYITDEKLVELGGLWDNIKFKVDRDLSREENLSRILKSNYVTGATMAIKKGFLQKILPFNSRVNHDHYIASMALVHNGLSYIPNKLIKYRQHAGNLIGVQSKIDRKRYIYRLLEHFKISKIRRNVYTRYNFYLARSNLLKSIKLEQRKLGGVELFLDYDNFIRVKDFVYSGRLGTEYFLDTQDSNSCLKTLYTYISYQGIVAVFIDIYDFLFFRFLLIKDRDE